MTMWPRRTREVTPAIAASVVNDSKVISSSRIRDGVEVVEDPLGLEAECLGVAGQLQRARPGGGRVPAVVLVLPALRDQHADLHRCLLDARAPTPAGTLPVRSTARIRYSPAQAATSTVSKRLSRTDSRPAVTSAAAVGQREDVEAAPVGRQKQRIGGGPPELQVEVRALEGHGQAAVPAARPDAVGRAA